MRYIGDSWANKQRPLAVSDNPEALIIGKRVKGVKVVGITRVPGTNKWEFWGETRSLKPKSSAL